jgi:hypothetical protein
VSRELRGAIIPTSSLFSPIDKYLRGRGGKKEWLNEIATSHKTLLAMTDLEWFDKANHIKRFLKSAVTIYYVRLM